MVHLLTLGAALSRYAIYKYSIFIIAYFIKKVKHKPDFFICFLDFGAIFKRRCERDLIGIFERNAKW